MATIAKTLPRSDDAIREDAVSELKWDPKSTSRDDIAVAVKDGVVELKRTAELDARRISVQVDGNTAKLYGTMRSWAEQDEAEQAAWSAPGIAKAENYITVIP